MGTSTDPDAPFRSRARALYTGVIAVSLLCVAVGTGWAYYFRWVEEDQNDDVEHAGFTFAANAVCQVLQSSEIVATDMLGVMAATMSVYTAMTFPDFVTISSVVRARSPQLSVGWVPRVSASERESWEQNVSAYVGRNLTFTQLEDLADANSDFIRRVNAPQYYPVTYVNPIQSQENLLLFDLLSIPLMSGPLQASIATGDPYVSPPVNLSAFGPFEPDYALLSPMGAAALFPV